MKAIFKLARLPMVLCFFAIIAPFSEASALSDPPGTGISCNQTFSPIYIRHEQRYKFGDDYINNSSNNHKIIKSGREYFAEWIDFNSSGGAGGAPGVIGAAPSGGTGNGSGEIFFRTQQIVDSSNIVPGNSRVPFLTNYAPSRGYGDYYNVYDHLINRSTWDRPDIFIKFFVEAEEETSPGVWTPLPRHTECQPYIITWCGDGVTDSTVGPGETWTAESCDDGVNNGQPGYCNASCTAKLPPVCGSTSGILTNFIDSNSLNLCKGGSVASFNSSTGMTTQGLRTNYYWSCTAPSGSDSCSANYTKLPVCGDGKKEGSESCDGTDGVPAGRQCTTSCTLEDKPPVPQCGSSVGILSGPINSTSLNLCNPAPSLTGFTPSILGNKTSYSWSCNNISGNQSCSAEFTNPVCGNNIKEGTESCDGTDGVPAGRQCTTSCTLEDKPPVPQCGSSVGIITEPITATSLNLCTPGNVTSFTVVTAGNMTNYNWSCNNTNGNQSCSANYTQPFCGNGTREGSEECDNGASNGNDGYCTLACQTDITPLVCNQTFTGSLRVGQTFQFTDKLTNTTGNNLTLNSFTAIFREPEDYNRSNAKFEFEWTPWIKSRSFIVPNNTVNQEIIQSKEEYHIIDHPAVRSFDNLKIDYGIRYQVAFGSQQIHKECIKYEITWCGDGILDTNIDTDLATPGIQGEQCDPNDPSRAGWGSGGCNATSCKPITTPDSFNLSLKKYVDTVAVENDAQNNSGAIEKVNSTAFSYKVVVTNNGPSSVSGITTVTDTLPEGVSFSGNVTGTTWSCSQATNNFTCTNSGVIASGSAFQVINIPVVTSALASGYINNTATVLNPGDTNTSDNTDPAVIHISSTPISQGTLSIKKYAGTMPAGDSQSESSAVAVSRGAEFNYLYRVTVLGGSVNGAIVRDALPEYVEFVRFGSTPAGWSTGSTATTHSGHLHTVVMHQTDNLLASGSSYDFTIVARLRADAVGQYHQNIAYVCAKKILSGGSLIDNPACTTTVPPLPPDTGCPARPADTQSDPACIRANDGFDLVIRKYINSDDAETAIDLANGATFNYRIVVTNNGPAAINGTTFVSDTFPAGVERTVGAITATGWNCSASSGSTLSCYSIQTIAAGGTFPEIIVPMRVTAGDNTMVTNTACVTNTNESTTKTLAGGDTTNCNSAVLKTPSTSCPTYPGESCGGGDSLRCIDLTLSSSRTAVTCRGNQYAQSYGIDLDGNGTIDKTGPMLTNIVTVETAGTPYDLSRIGTYAPKCIVSTYPGNTFPINLGERYADKWTPSLDTNDNSCKISITNTCNNPNGCGGGPSCGDGIVQLGEECDAGGGHIPLCNASCKIISLPPTTQPISYDLPFVTIIPKGGGPSDEYNLGRGKKLKYINGMSQEFKPFRLIIGDSTNVFRKDDRLLLRSPGYVFVADSSTQFGLRATVGGPITPNSLNFPIAGKCIGNFDDYTSTPTKDSSNSISIPDPSNPGNRIWQYCDPLTEFIGDLNQNNFKGTTVNSDFVETNNAVLNNNFTPVPLPSYNFYATLFRGSTEYLQDPIQVRVTRPIIANNAGGAGYFAGTNQPVDINIVAQDFLEQLKAANFNTGKVVGGSSSIGFTLDSIVPNSSNDLNGNTKLLDSTTRLLRHNGDVNLSLNSFDKISVKKTVVVNGTLTIDSDIKSDVSVAFIAKKIVIKNNVTRLDGIYIAEKIEGETSGSTSQLIVNGSLYGDASELIKARTYARGSSASSGIVTGILVNYSSRVLSDPPPLVSDFLKQYNLTKVTSVQ